MRIAIAAVVCGRGAQLQAQWHAIVLQPPQAQYSGIGAVYGHEAGGFSRFMYSQATVWDWSASTWGTLASGPDPSQVNGIWEDQRVGAWSGSATIWSGTGSTSLHPSGVGYSEALAVRDGMQVGDTLRPSAEHAAVWRNTAQSYVDLHPSGAVRSEARATDGISQGGWATVHSPLGDVQHAALWNGSAASFTDLNPSQSLESKVNGMAPGQQVGFVHPFGGQLQAADPRR
jgi:hypothetical protein